MNIKSILAATVLSALFAGTFAIAGDNDHFVDADVSVATQTVEFQKVSFEAAVSDYSDTNR